MLLNEVFVLPSQIIVVLVVMIRKLGLGFVLGKIPDGGVHTLSNSSLSRSIDVRDT